MVWPVILFDEGRTVPSGWTLYVEMSRPVTRKHLNYKLYPTDPARARGNMISTQRGCVKVEVYLVHGRDDIDQSEHGVMSTPCGDISLGILNVFR